MSQIPPTPQPQNIKSTSMTYTSNHPAVDYSRPSPSHCNRHPHQNQMTKLPFPYPNTHLIFLTHFLVILPFLVNSQLSAHERSTLLNVKRQWGDPPSLRSWNSTSSHCKWPEIRCAGDGTVTGIIIQDSDIAGEIPPSICDLENLTTVDLSNNSIGGGFPIALYNCPKLRFLDISQNLFVGPIPADIDQLRALQFIDVGGNNFTGDIPPAIGNLSELQTLNLYQNLFNGTFPAEIGNLSNLEVLGMAYNDFSPMELPPEFGKLKKLKSIWMVQTNLVGDIPESFGELSSLEQIDLTKNSLHGPIPSGLFSLKNLTIVYLYQNQLSGPIPSPIESMNLTDIDLSMNHLTGAIPRDVEKLQRLKILHLFWNQLSGEVPQGIGLIPTLNNFRIFNNNLTGELPPDLGLHSELQDFEISNNQFTGKLPENLCARKALIGVVAFSNNLTGGIPESLGNCDTMRTVQLYENHFSGEIPLGIWKLMDLQSLMLSDNSFSGHLPREVARNLSRLEISNNRFSGEIPAGVSTWRRLVVFKGSNNLFSGSIPSEITSLPQLTTLTLDGNSLSGQLPPEIISWRSLSTLNLARNQLSGQIPPAFGSLPDLLDMDLSENQFSGQIPTQLGRLRLTTLNLSSNQLTGKIPDEFNNMAYENSFLNNRNLCGSHQMPELRRCYVKTQNSAKLPAKFLAIVLVLAVTVFLVTILLTLHLIRDFRKKKLLRDITTWKLTSFQRVDFTEANILSSLTDGNLIGSGGSGKVYQVSVGRSGEYVAVKRIWSKKKLDQKLEKEFLAEVEILGTIRHSNIVKLLCCISSDDSKLLVYEYLENQSLEKWLHGKRGESVPNLVHDFVLDWPKRMEIAIGAAQGLCYMHHHCFPPIIHRDIKSSNILLDSEFKSKIADFGLAKTLAKQGEANTMSAVAGSFGYFAPEYAYTRKVSEKIDVYSFGVVLLELVTGREANDGDEYTSLAEWAWRHYGEGKPLVDALDEEIKEPCYFEEMTSVFKLGLICTTTSPSKRPSMKEVLQILRRCSPMEENGGKTEDSGYDAAPLLSNNDMYISNFRRSVKKVYDEADDNMA